MRLVADIGGTNARFALSNNGRIDPATRNDFVVADYPTFEQCLDAYFDAASINLQQIDEACASVAGPVVNNAIDFTNNEWSINANALGEKTGCKFTLINDFAAMAYASSTLTADNVKVIGDAELTPATNGSRLTVLGPGTGLGVANGFWTSDAFYPLAGEGGHITCSASTSEQHGLIEQIRMDLDIQRVSAERILSGPGLMNLYRAVCKLGQTVAKFDTPKQVTTHGKQNEQSIERHTLDLFCAFLGTCAGDLALAFGTTHGVFLAGGVTDALSDFLPTSGFRAAFEAKGRLSYFVKDMPTAIITAKDPGLLGAAVANI